MNTRVSAACTALLAACGGSDQQHIGTMGRAWFEPGRSFRVSTRCEF